MKSKNAVPSDEILMNSFRLIVHRHRIATMKIAIPVMRSIQAITVIRMILKCS